VIANLPFIKSGSKRSLIFLLSFVFCFLFGILNAQQKSSDVKTINGKKYYIHKVEKGQSLYAIAKLYETDVNLVLAENDEALDGIKPGQELKIPVITAAQNLSVKSNPKDTSRYLYHTVERKETLYGISKKYNTTEQRLVEWNPDVKSGIKHGQCLIVAERVRPVTTATIVPVKDTVVKPSKPKKAVYNIGLFLPFRLAEFDNIDVNALVQSKAPFPLLQSLSVDFLMGFKRAADSLKSNEFNTNILLFDVGDRDSSKVETICNSSEFKTLDLIIGPLYSAEFKVVSNYAKKAAIPVVSPFTQQNKILYQNEYSSKVTPSQFTLLESLAEYCIDSLKNMGSIFIVNNGNLKDAQYVKAFKQHYRDHLKTLNLPEKDTVVEVRGLAGVKSAYVPGKKNVFVALTNNQVFLTDFITQLAVYADKKDIVLAGWQNATQQDNIDQDYLNRLSYTFASQNNLNNILSYSTPIKEYQEEMFSDPGDYFFEGFDIAQYYLTQLKTIGPDFALQLDKLPFEGNFIRYKFYRPDETTGFENRGAYIFRYNTYQLQRIGWK
jgi:LysM repeat protein